jgi:hypothetical protein
MPNAPQLNRRLRLVMAIASRFEVVSKTEVHSSLVGNACRGRLGDTGFREIPSIAGYGWQNSQPRNPVNRYNHSTLEDPYR